MIRSRSTQPRAAAASTIAYSPLHLVGGDRHVHRRPDRGDDVEVGAAPASPSPRPRPRPGRAPPRAAPPRPIAPGPAGTPRGRRSAVRTPPRPGTDRRRRTRTSPSRPGSPPRRSRHRPAPDRIAPTCPSIIPLGATTCAPAAACATAIDAYRSSVASLSTEPSERQQSTVAVVGVLVQAQVGDQHGRVADLGGQPAQRHLDDPVRVVGRRAAAVLRRRDPEQHQPADAGVHRLVRGLGQRLDGVLHDPGHRRHRRRLRRSPP